MNDDRRNETHYQTGTVPSPRSHGGLVAVLLVMVVLLSGIITLLSLLNIRLFVALKSQEDSALHLQSTAAETQATEPDQTLPSSSPIDLQLQPEGVGLGIPSEELTPQQIYSNCIDSVVSVTCDGAAGTGVVIDEGGYIVTNYHLIQEDSQIQVRLSDDRQLTACLVGSDPVSDLAVLYVEAQGLAAAVFGDSDTLQVGDTVCAIGDPMGDQVQGTMTNGTVSAIDGGQIRTDVLGNNTGPLLDRFGNVIGIHAGVDPEGGDFVIPSATVKQIVEQLIGQGYVSGRPGLGILWEPLTELYRHYYELPAGLYITEVTGCQGLAVGDILISVDGIPVTTGQELTAALLTCQVGDLVELEIYRDDRYHTVDATVQEAKG